MTTKKKTSKKPRKTAKKKSVKRASSGVSKKPVGRKPLLIRKPEIVSRLVMAIQAGNYVNVALQYAGISHGSFYAWLERGERERQRIELEAEKGKDVEPAKDEAPYLEFMEAIKKAESEAEVAAVAAIRKSFGKNWLAAMTYLERKYPDRWGRSEKRFNMNLNADLDKVDLSKLNRQDLNELERILAKTTVIDGSPSRTSPPKSKPVH